MKVNKQTVLVGITGLLAGLLIAGTGAVLAVNNNNIGLMRMMGMHTKIDSQGMMDDADMSMGEMMGTMANKSGDEFDKAFLAQMIIHHKGAIEMANSAKQNAKHEEIKKLADDILSAQSKEIDMMQSWQTDWGYKTTPSIESHGM